MKKFSCGRKKFCVTGRNFLSQEELYRGIEVTVHSINAAAVKISVESDVESLVSRYEKHLKINRQMY